MSVSLSGSLYLWAIRFLALLMTLIVLFNVNVPTLVLGIAWALLLLFSFVTLTGQSAPPG